MLGLLIGAAVGAGINAIGNYYGQKSAQEDARQRSEAIQRAYASAMLSQGEIAKRVDMIGDTFDTAMQDTANSMAASGRSILNPSTVRAIATSKIMGQKLQAMNQTQTQLENFNKDLSLKAGLALASSSPESMNWGQVGMNAASGAIAGAQLGISIEKSEALKKDSGKTDGDKTDGTKTDDVKTDAEENPKVETPGDNTEAIETTPSNDEKKVDPNEETPTEAPTEGEKKSTSYLFNPELQKLISMQSIYSPTASLAKGRLDYSIENLLKKYS